MRLKKSKTGGYIDRDTGKPVPNHIAMPVIYGFTLAGYKGYMNSPSFKISDKNRIPISLTTIAERLGGRKEDYTQAKHMVAVWLTDRKLARASGEDFTTSFPSP